MRIGIDARLLNESGVGRYLKNLIFHLQNLDKDNEYFIFLLKKDIDELTLKENFQKVGANFTWYGFDEQLNFPPLLNKYKLDLLHTPHFNVPIFYSGKIIVTIHDLIHQHFRMKRATVLNPFIYLIKQGAYKIVFKKAVSESARLITVSEYVKTQLVKEWSIDPNKISVTYEGVDANIIKIASKIPENNVKKVLEKFQIKHPFIFYLGNAHPHKNVEGLIRAFLTLKKNHQYLQLVLSGKDHYFWQRIKKEFNNPNIIYTGFLSDEEMIALYKSAKVYVFPSFEEGFGIPLLEAMACGCPVVSSKEGSLPEIGGDASIYFDPQDKEDMASKIGKVLNNLKLQKELTEKGKTRYKKFSWEKMAMETWEIYSQCL